ncbi:MAG: glycosyltransferase family 39 protein [bacterium]|nr:glycosyltransferase family 39 protein [bacterium]
MKKFIWILLLVTIILGSVLRLWQLGNIPPSPDWDEASLGYDAYSILHTGRDQFGKFLPVDLRSFNDYKPAFYAYLVMPSIYIFDLNIFAVRFPSAIFGILSVLATYFLVKELFSIGPKTLRPKAQELLALLSALFMAISPLSIQFSRVGFESNVGTAFNIFAALFFLKGLKKPWLLSVSIACAGLAIYTYQSEKVFTPLLLLMLVLLSWKKLILINKKYLVSAFVIGMVVIFPMIQNIITDKSSLERLRGTSVFSSQTELLKAGLRKLDRDEQNNDQLGLLLDNRRIIYAKTILQGYFSHFDLNWLFVEGDIARHHAHGMGIMYLFELPFLLLGIYSLLTSGKFDRRAKLIVFLWILITPIPASVTVGVPSAVRTLNFLPMLQILTAVGILSAFEFFKNRNLKKASYILILTSYILFSLFNILYFLNQYFVQSNYYDSAYWQYGYKEAVNESLKLQNKYQKIVVSNSETMNQSHIFFLFYLKYPPQDYQEIIKNQSKDVVDNSFGKYIFREVDWEKDSLLKNVLFIAAPNEIPKEVQTIKTIYSLDGTPVIKIAGT